MLICLLATAWTAEALAQPEPEIIEDRKKLGQTGMQFLTVSVDARAAALADAVTAQGGTSVSLFYNPAGIALVEGAAHVALGQNRWFTDIGYNYASAAFRPAGGTYGTVGLSIVAVDYGEIQQTIRANNDQGFEDVGTYEPTALSVGLGYARSLTDRFSVGGQVKYVTQSAGTNPVGIGAGGGLSMEDYTVSTVAVDFGVIYMTGFRSLALALDVRNFSRELTYAEENFELPLTFQVGMAMDMADLAGFSSDAHSFVLAVDASHPRSYVEQVKVGGEYAFMNTLSLRAGYIFPTDEQGVNLGLGLHHAVGDIGFGFDYGYTDFGLLGNVHRIGFQLAL